MRGFEQHEGSWTGTNGFRLMPGDPLSEAPLTARISTAAKGNLVQFAYTWEHPKDGAQDGLLVLGPGDASDAVAAFWGDSWHQSPHPRSLDGGVDESVVRLGYDYSGEWRWEIVVDVTNPDALSLTMHNVIPESAATPTMAAGPYAAMAAVLRRTA